MIDHTYMALTKEPVFLEKILDEDIDGRFCVGSFREI